MVKTAAVERVKRLKAHLEQENPALAEAIGHFQELDRITRKLGFMDENESTATQVSWWPVVAVLGTFSAGKSTFLNEYLGQSLQRTGNQAVDDRFTVISYGPDDEIKQLPGLALDSDPRLPFYQISEDIERVASGEGKRIDAYLQLKTTNAPALKGKIFIDSPGFDADQQRTSTLLITEHIIDLSDLVLVFFDARHPEPGAMADTLKHLVAGTVNRTDSAKFLYILNQIDNTAREDNPEEVVAAWQRALAQAGLTAGHFYRIYAESAAVQIEDPQTRERLRTRRDEDLGKIRSRIDQLEVERAYRITGTLESAGKRLRDNLIPRLMDARRSWLRRSRWLNGLVFGGATAAFLYWSITADAWDGFRLTPLIALDPSVQLVIALVIAGLAAYVYSLLRKMAGRSVLRGLRKHSGSPDDIALASAFEYNLGGLFVSLSTRPRGWSSRTARKLNALIASSDTLVEKMNDQFARPSGGP